MNDNNDLSLDAVHQNEIDQANLLADAQKRVANLKAAQHALNWDEVFRHPSMREYLYAIDVVGPFAEHLANQLYVETERLIAEAERDVTARERDYLKAQKTLREVVGIVRAQNERNAKAG